MSRIYDNDTTDAEGLILDRSSDLWLPDPVFHGSGADLWTPERLPELKSARDEEIENTLTGLARISFLGFLRLWFRHRKLKLVEGWYLQYLCEIAEAVVRGDEGFKRLIINLPPRFLKSEIFCVALPAWALGVDYSPRSQAITASYSHRLAERDSRRSLELVKSKWYKRCFPWVKLHPKKQAAEEWWVVDQKTGADVACRYAAGTGGTLTGMGGNLLIGDDLIKPADANSEVMRTDANEWLGETWYSRINDQELGRMVIVAQRLHEEDPCGYLLNVIGKRAGAEKWKHISLANECEKRVVYSIGDFFHERKPGELLCIERLDHQRTAALKAVLGHNYDGQYQQRPSKQEGAMLKPKLLQRIPLQPLEIIKQFGLRVNFYMDLASKEKQTQKDSPDYTSISVMGKDSLHRIHLLDVWREQAAQDRVSRQLILMHKLYRPSKVKGEKGALLHTLKPTLMLVSRLVGYPLFTLFPLSPSGDKVQKAGALEGILNAGLLCVPAGAPWLADVEAEWRQFPNGPHDDTVDSTGYGCTDLQSILTGDPEPTHQKLEPHQIDEAMMQGYKDRLEAAKRKARGEPERNDDW